MAMNADLLEILSPTPARLIRLAPPPLTYREVQQGHHPGRGLGLSILFHLSVFLLIISGRSLLMYSPRVVPERAWQPTDSAPVVLYLPVLGGGSEGGGHVGGGSSNTAKASSGLRSRSRRGFAYPGPQPMASSPPRATLGIQTILQPALVSPPLLKRDLPLPNIVRPAAPPVTAAAQDAIVVKRGKLTLPRNPDPPVAAPKITLPAAQSSAITDLVMVKPTLPEKPTPANTPLSSDVSVMPDVRRHQEGLLVLNAIPPPPGLHPNLPRAEARGLFAVAPAEATVIADPAAGAKAGEASSPAAGTGTRADIATGDALAEPATGGNESGRVAGGSGSGSGGRYGSGHGSGLNPAGTGVSTGRGTGSEPGIGEGSGGSRGSGAGAGSSPGTGGFPGIGIQGGRYGNDTASGLHPSVAPRQQTSYNLTIVSTASSGGGLPDLGVFHNEKVYTVYLDMKADDEDPAPAWTLQYAILQPPLNPAETSSKIQGTPAPPYAMLKEIPEFAPDVLRKYAHKLIIASAVMTAAGNLEQITVQQNPDPQLASALVEALSHWMFHPAQIEGKPVPLKILLGIRLAPGR